MFSKAYQDQQRGMHKLDTYGVKGVDYWPQIEGAAKAYNVESVIDYGCGPNARLKEWFEPRGYKYIPYDIVEPFNQLPPLADMVVCCDVLEHVERKYIRDVIEHIAHLAQKVIFLSIHEGPAKKTLPDGRNAHLIQQHQNDWYKWLCESMEIQWLVRKSDREFFCIATPTNTG